MASTDNTKRNPAAKSFNEKMVKSAAVVSVGLYSALVVYLVAIGLFAGPNYAEFEVVTSDPRLHRDGVQLQFELTNTGTKSVAEVHVGAISDGQKASEIVFDYVPAGSTRRGTMVISESLLRTNPQIAVTSYSDP